MREGLYRLRESTMISFIVVSSTLQIYQNYRWWPSCYVFIGVSLSAKRCAANAATNLLFDKKEVLRLYRDIDFNQFPQIYPLSQT